MPLILRDTNYAGGTNKNDTLTYSELDGNFVYLDEKIDNISTTDTGSLLATASVDSNTITFTKGDGSTFDITVDTGSATSVNTGSLLVTASVSSNTITFTKGDGSTFPITVNTGSIPTLQQVTTAGSTTNIGITVSKAGGDYIIIENTSSPKTAYLGTQIGSSAVLGLSNTGGNVGEIYAENITTNRTYQLPNQNGTLAVFPYTGSAQITGSLGVTGSISSTGNITTVDGNIQTNNGKIGANLINGDYIFGGSNFTGWNLSNTYPVYAHMLRISNTNLGSATNGGYTFSYGDTNIGHYVPREDFNTPAGAIKFARNIARTVLSSGGRGRIPHQVIISDNYCLDDNVVDYTYTQANGRYHTLTVTGSILSIDGVSLGTNISNTHAITGSVNATGSINVVGNQTITGSATITDVLTLPYQDPLPSNKPTGSIAVSGSGATLDGLYLYNGTSWIKLSV